MSTPDVNIDPDGLKYTVVKDAPELGGKIVRPVPHFHQGKVLKNVWQWWVDIVVPHWRLYAKKWGSMLITIVSIVVVIRYAGQVSLIVLAVLGILWVIGYVRGRKRAMTKMEPVWLVSLENRLTKKGVESEASGQHMWIRWIQSKFTKVENWVVNRDLSSDTPSKNGYQFIDVPTIKTDMGRTIRIAEITDGKIFIGSKHALFGNLAILKAFHEPTTSINRKFEKLINTVNESGKFSVEEYSRVTKEIDQMAFLLNKVTELNERVKSRVGTGPLSYAIDRPYGKRGPFSRLRTRIEGYSPDKHTMRFLVALDKANVEFLKDYEANKTDPEGLHIPLATVIANYAQAVGAQITEVDTFKQINAARNELNLIEPVLASQRIGFRKVVAAANLKELQMQRRAQDLGHPEMNLLDRLSRVREAVTDEDSESDGESQ